MLASLNGRPPCRFTRGMYLAAAFALASSLAACTKITKGVCPVGTVWCDCTNTGACDPGLTCVDGPSGSGGDRFCKGSTGDPALGQNGGPGPEGYSSAGHTWCRSMGGKAPVLEPKGGFIAGWGTAWTDVWIIINHYFDRSVDGIGPPTNPSTFISAGYDYGLVHWDGQTFCEVRLDQLFLGEDLRKQSDLYAIWGNSPSDIWAVGQDGLALRWNGISWTVAMTNTQRSLTTILGNRPDNVYALAVPTPGFRGGALHRWDGTRWLEVASQESLSSDDLWIDGKSRLWMSHWLGSCNLSVNSGTTAETCLLELPDRTYVDRLHGAGETPWVITVEVFGGYNKYRVLEFDGTTWRYHDFPHGEFLRDIRVFSSSEVWVSASDALWRWNGNAWTKVLNAPNSIFEFWGSTNNDVWSLSREFMVHWNGQEWQKASL